MEVPESIRISYAQPLLKRYGPNIVCRSLKIRKSNLYYHTLRRPEMTVCEKHNLELTPGIQEICGDGLKRMGAGKIRQRLISQGFSVSKRKVLELLREISPWMVPPQRKNECYYSRKPPKGLLFHSDQGGQYRSQEFRSLLLDHKVRQSFSAPGILYDNAPVESFFASLKVKEIYRFRYVGIKDLTASLRNYISFYNNKRPHTSNGGRTPAKTELEYFQKHGAVEATGCAF